jgi:hypothetical protein
MEATIKSISPNIQSSQRLMPPRHQPPSNAYIQPSLIFSQAIAKP